MHKLQTRTIYIFIIYKYSFKERTLNKDCNIFSALLRFYTYRSSFVSLLVRYNVAAPFVTAHAWSWNKYLHGPEIIVRAELLKSN